MSGDTRLRGKCKRCKMVISSSRTYCSSCLKARHTDPKQCSECSTILPPKELRRGRCPKCSNARARQYQADKYYRNQAKWIKYLGGACVVCSSTDELHFDHIDPNTKECNVTDLFRASSQDRILREVQKCQLLCVAHHVEKSIMEGDLGSVGHGEGLSGKRNCSCPLCREKKSQYMREWHTRKAVKTKGSNQAL